MNRVLGLLLLGFACSPRPAQAPPDFSPNSLSQKDVSDGWKLLFDGRSIAGWRGYKHGDISRNWGVQDGSLVVSGEGTDLVTDVMYRNFDLMLDWKVEPGGNSGVMYRGLESENYVWQTAPEMQILDDERHPDGKDLLTSAGSLFAIYPAARGTVRPAGEWNTARIVVNGNHVEHWLNGNRLVEAEIGSEDFKRRVAASKFRTMPNFGKASTGLIALQSHGDRVEFRNIRIRVLP